MEARSAQAVGSRSGRRGRCRRVNLLEVRDLQVAVGAVDIVDIDELKVEHGRNLAIVGESGSGKTMMAMSLIGLQASEAKVTGSIRLSAEEIAGRSERDLRSIRGRRIGVV